MLILIKLSPQVKRYNSKEHFDFIKAKNDLYLLCLSGGSGQIYVKGTLLSTKGAFLDTHSISIDDVKLFEDYTLTFFPSMIPPLIDLLDTLSIGHIEILLNLTGLFYKNDQSVICRVDSIQGKGFLDKREIAQLSFDFERKNDLQPPWPFPGLQV
jgi:hypothetical protein